MSRSNKAVTVSLAETSHQSVLPLPSELTLDILKQLPYEDQWSFAQTCRSAYSLARSHFLFREVRLGWSYVLGFARTAKGLFNPKTKTAERFIKDVEFAKYIGIGHLIRKAYIGLETNSRDDCQDLEDTMVTAILELLEFAREITTAHVFGTNKSVLYCLFAKRLGSYCENVTTLTMQWSWDRQPEFPGMEDTFLQPIIAAELPKSLQILKLELYADSDRDHRWQISAHNFLQSVVMPLLRSSLGGGLLRELHVRICNGLTTREEAVHWDEFQDCNGRSELKVLRYEVVHVPHNTRAVTYLNDICKAFPSLEELSVRQGTAYPHDQTDSLPNAILEKLPDILGKLQNCRVVHLGLNMASDPTGDSDSSDVDEEFINQSDVSTSFEKRKRIATEVAKRMPKLELFKWPLHCDGDLMTCDMKVLSRLLEDDVDVKFSAGWEPSY